MEQNYREAQPDTITLFIGGLSKETSIREIVGFFENYSPVVDVHIPVHKVTGKPVGYAFVKLTNFQAAKWLTGKANCIGGRIVDIQIAIERQNKKTYQQELLSRKVFIAGIKHHVDYEHIKDALEKHGPLKIFYRIDTSHKNRGLAFAEFQQPNAASSVTSQGLTVDGCPLRVSYFRPRPEEGVNTPQLPNLPTQERIDTLSQSLEHYHPLNSEEGPQGTTDLIQQLIKKKETSISDESNYLFRIVLKTDLKAEPKKVSVNGVTIYLKNSLTNSGGVHSNTLGDWEPHPKEGQFNNLQAHNLSFAKKFSNKSHTANRTYPSRGTLINK